MAKQTVAVQLFYGGVWNTTPAYVDDPIRISRGRPEGAEPTPTTATLSLAGYINPKSPMSPLYGLAGQNTPARIFVDGGIRIYGEVSSWEPRRTIDYNEATGRGKAWTAITISGIGRRLGQGADPLLSAHTRAITLAGTALGHWPLEDSERSTVAQSPTDGVAPAAPVTEARYTTADGVDIPPGGAPKFGVGVGPIGSAKLVDVTAGGTLEGIVPLGGTGWTVEFVFRMLPGAADGSTSVDIFRWYETGKYQEFIVNVTQAGVTVFHEDPISGDDGSADAAFNVFDGTAHHFRYTTSQSGGNYLSRLYIDGNLMATADNFGSAMTGTIGQVNRWTLNPLSARGDEMPAAFGQVVVWPSSTPPSGLVDAAFGHNGELVADRFFRLCQEEGIANSLIGTDTDTQTMGPQPRETLADLFAELERTDDGILLENRTGVGLRFRTGRDRYNQDPALVLDYAANEVAPPLSLVIDDLSSRNDITVKNRDAGQARAVLEDGPLSVQDPPDGIGRYATDVNVNTATDAVLPDHAWWHLAKGTVRGARYTSVTVDLDAKPSLETDVASVDLGDVIAIDNLPEDEATGRVRLLVVGYTEVVGSHRRVITFDTIPAGPYDIAVYGTDPGGIVARYGARHTVLAEDLTTSETSALVDPAGETWMTTASHPSRFPFNVTIGGLDYSCTAIASSVRDTFGGSSSSGWGTSDSGQVWSVGAGTASLFSETSGVGRIAVSALNTEHYIAVDTSYAARQKIRVYQTLGVTPTGAGINWGGMLRYSNASNLWWIDVQVGTDNSLTLRFISKVSSTNTQRASVVSATVHSTSVARILVAEIDENDVIRAKVYASGSAEPGWELIYDASALAILQTGTAVGCIARLMTSNTNTAPVAFNFDNFEALNPYEFTLVRLASDKTHASGDPVTVTDTGTYGL